MFMIILYHPHPILQQYIPVKGFPITISRFSSTNLAPSNIHVAYHYMQFQTSNKFLPKSLIVSQCVHGLVIDHVPKVHRVPWVFGVPLSKAKIIYSSIYEPHLTTAAQAQSFCFLLKWKLCCNCTHVKQLFGKEAFLSIKKTATIRA